MLKKKEKRPALEINLNLVPLLESLGLDETVERTAQTVRKGKTEILDKLVSRAKQGQMEVTVNIGKKKKKVPISFVVRLKKAKE